MAQIVLTFLLSVGAEVAPVAEAPAWNAMLEAVNEVRAEGATCGGEWQAPAPALAWNGQLGAAALEHSRDMAENDHFAHLGTDGRSVGDRVSKTGYDWQTVGENLARNQVSVSQVIDDWLASPSHCRQLLAANYSEFGAAKSDGYWAQVFGHAR